MFISPYLISFTLPVQKQQSNKIIKNENSEQLLNSSNELGIQLRVLDYLCYLIFITYSVIIIIIAPIIQMQNLSFRESSHRLRKS